MSKPQDDVFLQFDFNTNSGAAEAPLIFTRPLEIISTYSFEEVASCLEQIEQKVADGYYTAGYFSYEMTYALNNMELNQNQQPKMPLLWFGVFDQPVTPSSSETKEEAFVVGDWKPQVTQTAYERAFSTIMKAIQRKETAQINYTIPFEATFSGDAFSFYNHLKKAQQSNYCAYLNLDEPYTILSASPELFFHVKEEMITVRPMKGTAKRGKSSQEDQRQKRKLQQSPKNKLENQLIINLMKQELEKVASASSIQVIDKYRLEQYPTVFQLTTGIQGKLKDNMRISDIIRALFLCGSIAGDPKHTSISIIQETEKQLREVYCGAIGYITPHQEAVFNVPIRTVWLNQQSHKAHYGAGGAITENSNVKEEYKEALTKTDILHLAYPDFALLETIRLENGEIFLLEKHLERLLASATYFSITVDTATIRETLNQTERTYPKGVWRIRLTLNDKGETATSVQPLTDCNLHNVRLAQQAINKENVFHYHKTTHRVMYQEHQIDNLDYLDTLLWNEQNEVTEFTIGNIVVEINGMLYTPPLSSGLLPGTFRQQLLERNVIQEKHILKENLPDCERIWLINSVRKWVEVSLKTSE